MKKIIIIISTLLILTISTIILYKKNKLNITINDNIEVHSNKKLSDITNVNIIDDYKIDTSTIGKKTIPIKYKNGLFTYKDNIEINIIDKIPPTLLVRDITLEKGSDLNPNFFCGDNYDKTPNCYVEGEYDTSNIGTYNLEYIGIDNSNNKTKKDFKLNIVEKINTTYEDSYIPFETVIEQFKTENTMIGIDVSKWQKQIDFKKIKEAGCEFVIIKAGGSYIDNTLYTDPYFYENIENAIKNNIKVGVYFYSNSNSIKITYKEAMYLKELIKDYDVSYVAYDWENFNDYGTYEISIHKLNDMANLFLSFFENPLLYGSKYYLENIWEPIYDVWVAQYSNKNTYNKDYKIWQHCSDGKIDGIDGYVDIDILYK